VVGVRQQIDTGDLVFSWSGTLASRIWDRGPALLNQHLFRVMERPGVLRGWLYLALDHAVSGLMEKAHGTTMKHVTKRVLESHPVLLPPMDEQRRMVDLICSFDAHIEAIRNEIASLRAFGTALLMFTFLAKDSVDEWSAVPFASAIDFREGPGIMAVDFRDRGVPLIRLAGLTPGQSLLTKCNYLDPVKVDKKWAHFRVEVGDVLLSTSASLGRVAVVDSEAAGGVPYTGIIRMRPATKDLDAGFIPWILRSPGFGEQVEAAGVGTVMAHFGPSHLRQMSVSFPPLAEQRRIADVMEDVDADQQALESELDNLRAFRSTLLTSLLNQDIAIPASFDAVLAQAV